MMTPSPTPVFPRALVCTDASEASQAMLSCVEGLRAFGVRSVLLVHVIDVRNVGGLYETLRREIVPQLEAQQRALEKAGLEVEIEVPLGAVSEEVNRLAQERGCSLVVAGSRGHTLARDIVLGGTACALLHSARLPVFLVRIELVEEEGGKRCRAVCESLAEHVLFPTDFSDTAERAFQVLRSAAITLRPRVTLLHVQDRAKLDPHLRDRLEEFNQIDRERLERMRGPLLESGARAVDVQIEYGSPTQVLLERTRSGRFSLIVMGTQGRGFIEEVFLGSVAHSMARYAPLPVLFVPATARAGARPSLRHGSNAQR